MSARAGPGLRRCPRCLPCSEIPGEEPGTRSCPAAQPRFGVRRGENTLPVELNVSCLKLCSSSKEKKRFVVFF